MDNTEHILDHLSGKTWYPSECCEYLQHCKPVACDQILQTAKGYLYQGLEFTGTMVKSSQDALCHVCMSSWQALKGPLCVFIQMNF